MSLVTIIYGSLFYFATLILFAGIAYRIYEYATIPAPLKIPTPPAPTKPRMTLALMHNSKIYRKYAVKFGRT